ncbi:MFS transporter [Thermococcus sp.]
MSQRINASLHAKRVAHIYHGVSSIRTPRWFYSFIPFKIATGGSSLLIPLYLLGLGGSAKDAGLLVALASLSSMLGSLFWGRLSDRTLKRKPFILMGMASTSVFLPAMAFAGTPYRLMFLNALYSFFLASTVSVPIVLVLRSVRKYLWDYGIGRFNQISGWAWVGGLVLGLGLIRSTSIQTLLVIFAAINGFSVIWAARTIREAPIYVSRENIRNFRNHVVEKVRYMPSFILHTPTKVKSLKHRAFYLSAFLFWLSSGIYFTQFPVFLSGVGIDKSMIYLAAVLNSGISAFMYLRVGLLLQNRNGLHILKRGLATRLIAVGIMALSTLISPLLLPAALISYALAGYSWSFIGISSTSIVGRLAGDREKGSAMGFLNLVNSLGYIAGSLMSGFLVDYGFVAAFTAGALFVALSMRVLKGLTLSV